jgi:uncharacterized phage protein (TIGR02216 family)
MTQHFPWKPILRFGLHHLKLPPHIFWASTLRELSIGAGTPHDPLTRTSLAFLMKTFPDDNRT